MCWGGRELGGRVVLLEGTGGEYHVKTLCVVRMGTVRDYSWGCQIQVLCVWGKRLCCYGIGLLLGQSQCQALYPSQC